MEPKASFNIPKNQIWPSLKGTLKGTRDWNGTRRRQMRNDFPSRCEWEGQRCVKGDKYSEWNVARSPF